MDNSDENLHSFIVRLWREYPIGRHRVLWRGHITHIPSGKRKHVESLGDAVEFMESYLNPPAHIRVSLGWRVRNKLERWMSCLRS